MTATTTPAPRPLCAAFAPLLALLSSGALEDNEATPTREHVAGCAWCQQEMERYTAVDEALRRQFGAASDGILPFLFDLDGDDDFAEDYAFTLEDTLEETMAEGYDPRDPEPSTTTRSSRWGDRKRGLSPRVTAIAGIAAVLILAVVAATIYARFAAPRASSPAATTTAGGAFAKVFTAPNATGGLTVTSDGSLWFTEYADLHSKIGRLSPDGTLTEFPIPFADKAKHAGVGDMTLGPDGNLWFESSYSFTDQTGLSSIVRMTLDGAMTTFPLPPNVFGGPLIVGPDKALWFSEGEANKLGRMTIDGHVTEFPIPYPLPLTKGDGITSLCIGPDGALWFNWFRSNDIGRMTLDGKAQNFAVPYQASAITSGPDGALWFPEVVPPAQQDQNNYSRKGVIGRITTSGVYSEVSINPTFVAIEIVTGPDGAIWFSAFDQADSTLKLGRLTASGDVKLYSTNEYGTSGSLAAVPGAIWMLNGSNNTLWRYRLPA